MTFRPAEKNKNARFLGFSAVALACGLFYTSAIVDRFPFFYQLGGILLMIVGLEVFIKYVLNDYVYEATEKEIKVFRVNGKKSVCTASLAYEESLCEAVTGEAFETRKKDFPTTSLVINACKTVFPREYALYYFRFNGKNALLKFEPDEAFFAFLNTKIRAALAAKEDVDHE